MLVGTSRIVARTAPGLSRSICSMSRRESPERRTIRVATAPASVVGHEPPPWGVARKITRRTLGTGSKKNSSRASFRASSDITRLSSGRLDARLHRESPLDETWSRHTSPPMLYPRSTMFCIPGSTPEGSKVFDIFRSFSRRIAAVRKKATPVG